MREIVMYEANDGSRFTTASAALAHEAETRLCNEIMGALPIDASVPHDRYIQLDGATCRKVKRELLEALAAKHKCVREVLEKHSADEVHPFGFVGRLLDDSSGVMARAFGKLGRINWDNYRMYEQPFFALNPDKAPTVAMSV